MDLKVLFWWSGGLDGFLGRSRPPVVALYRNGKASKTPSSFFAEAGDLHDQWHPLPFSKCVAETGTLTPPSLQYVYAALVFPVPLISSWAVHCSAVLFIATPEFAA